MGASGAIAAVLGGYALLYPRARVLTLFFVFFIFLVEIPAMVMLGIWILLQFLPAVGQLGVAGRRGPGRRRLFRPYRGLPVRAAADQAVRDTAQHRLRGWRTASIRCTDAAMQTAALVVVLAFIVLFASLTISVIAQSGIDLLSVLALFFLVVIGVPVIGSLLKPPPDDD